MTDKVVFHLARDFGSPSLRKFVKPSNYPDSLTIYELYKQGFKDTEFRYLKKGFDDYWLRRLIRPLTGRELRGLPLDLAAAELTAVNMSRFLKVHKAWLVEGYPKGALLPRLEGNILKLLLYPQRNFPHIAVKLSNLKEIIKC